MQIIHRNAPGAGLLLHILGQLRQQLLDQGSGLRSVQQGADLHIKTEFLDFLRGGHQHVVVENVVQEAECHALPHCGFRVFRVLGIGNVAAAGGEAVVAVSKDMHLIGDLPLCQQSGKLQGLRGGHQMVALSGKKEGRGSLVIHLLQQVRQLHAQRLARDAEHSVAQQHGRRTDPAHGAHRGGKMPAGREACHGDLLRVDVQVTCVLMQVVHGLLRLGKGIGIDLLHRTVLGDTVPQHKGIVACIQKGQRYRIGFPV